MKTYIIILLSSWCISAYCQNDNKVSIEYYKGKDSLLIKNISQYDKKGNLTCRISYYKNGIVEAISNWCDGVSVGYFTIYYENGQLKEWARYNYYPSYKKLPEICVVDTSLVEYSQCRQTGSFWGYCYKNPRVGEFVTYYSNGQIESIGTYKDYKCTKKQHSEIKIGIWKYYSEHGDLLYEITFDENGHFISDKFYW